MALCAREISFDVCYVQRAERRMSDSFTTAGSVGHSCFGDRLLRGTRMRRPYGLTLENLKLVGRWFQLLWQSVQARGTKAR